SLSLWHDRVTERHSIDAFLEQAVGHTRGQRGFAQHDRDDRVIAGYEGKAERVQLCPKERRVLAQRGPQRLSLSRELQRLEGGSRDHRGEGVREQVGTGPLAQELDDFGSARRSEEHTSEIQYRVEHVCRLLIALII